MPKSKQPDNYGVSELERGNNFEKVFSEEDLEKLSFTSIKISSGQLSREWVDIITERKRLES